MPDFWDDPNSLFYGAMRPLATAATGALTTISDWGNTPIPDDAPLPGISPSTVSTSSRDAPHGFSPYRPTGTGVVRGTGPSMRYSGGGNSLGPIWDFNVAGFRPVQSAVDSITGLPVSNIVNTLGNVFGYGVERNPNGLPATPTTAQDEADGVTESITARGTARAPGPPGPAHFSGAEHTSRVSPGSPGFRPGRSFDPSRGGGSFIRMPSPGTSASVANGMTDTGASLTGRAPHSYAEGGLIGPDGPVRPGDAAGNTPDMNAQPTQQVGLNTQSSMPMRGGPQPMPSVKNTGKPMPAQQLQAQAQQAMRQNPQLAQELRKIIEYAVSSGEVSQQQLTQMVQLAKVAVSNPAAWNQVRTFAIQQGLAEEGDIPQEYDQPLLFILIAIGMAMESKAQEMAPAQPTGGDPNMPLGTADPNQGVVPSLSIGGPVHSKTIAEVHGGEYVMPPDVVLFHGLKGMEGMVKAARTPKKEPNE